MLLTDIVGSTERASALGDARWHALLVAHRSVVRRQLKIFRGSEIKTTGDGFLATFDSPAPPPAWQRASSPAGSPRLQGTISERASRGSADARFSLAMRAPAARRLRQSEIVLSERAGTERGRACLRLNAVDERAESHGRVRLAAVAGALSEPAATELGNQL
jgi:class 3 adenylate cyclase